MTVAANSIISPDTTHGIARSALDLAAERIADLLNSGATDAAKTELQAVADAGMCWGTCLDQAKTIAARKRLGFRR